jgi:YebC/PmpR family DNA-binding regulatory protein
MPLDNIDRAIKKGSGEGEGGALIEMVMEGYGPGGTAILVNALSDNRNRTVQEIRSTFTRHGGSLAESGSVSWLFESKGVISIDAANVNADDIALQAIDAGAEDVQVQNGSVEVYTAPENLMKVRQALEKAKFSIASGELVKEPKTMVSLDEKSALQALKLIDKLENLDDVQNVYSNADIPESVMDSYESAA